MDMEYVESNDIYFNQNTALMLDEKSIKLIEAIDGAKLISRFKICSSFNDTVLDCWMTIQESIFRWMIRISI